MNLRTVVTVEEVGSMCGGHGAVFMCDGKPLTVSGLTESEARELGKKLFQQLVVEIRDADQTTAGREKP